MRAPVVDLSVSHTTSQCNVLPSNSSVPPAIVVNAAAGLPSEGPPGPDPPSSRYSSLLSVLADVIGPDRSTSSQDAMDAMFSECPHRLSSHSVTASGNDTMVTESDLTLVGRCDSEDSISSIPSDSAVPLNSSQPAVPSWQGSVYANPPPTCNALDLEEPRISSGTTNGEEAVECFVCEADPVPPWEDNGVSRVVEAEGVAMTEYDTEEFEHEPTATPFGRRSLISVVSPFSGVSLLASPQDTCNKTFTCCHAQVHTPDLLSPVQMSTKLRPFSLSSSRCTPRRGDSIDSGYAEGDSWIDPEPLSRSPPLKASPYLISSLRYSRSLQSTSPLVQERELAYCMSSGRSTPSLGSIEASVPEETEDCDDDTSSIIEIYSSSSDVEGSSSPTMKISDFATQHEAHADEMSAPLNSDLSSTAITSTSPDSERSKVSGLRKESSEQLTDNRNTLSGAALSAQPSFDFSDASSRVSLSRHDSPLSSCSGSSTPNTSLFSQVSDSSPVEECLPFPNLANADQPSHSQEFQHVMDEDAIHRTVLAPFRNMVGIERESHSPQLGPTDDYEESDDDVSPNAEFPPCFPTPTRQEDAGASQALETGGGKFLLETIASSGVISAEGVLQFPMPPTSEDAALPAFFECDVTFQQLALHDAADMRCLPSIANNRSAQLICAPSDLAVDVCPGLPDTNRMLTHSPVFGKPASYVAGGAGEAQCSSLSSLHLLGQQVMDNDPRDNHASCCYTRGPPFMPRDADISSKHESQHIALRSPWRPPCSPSPPAAISQFAPPSILSRSGSVFRPLLTGRKSLLEVSLFGDRISQNTVARDRSITISAPSHARAKEVGGASVSLNSPQYTEFPAKRPTLISDDVLESSSSHPRSHSAPPCRGLKPLKLSSNHTTRKFSSATSPSSIASVQSSNLDTSRKSTVRSPSVLSSTISLGHNSLLSSPCHSLPEHNRITLSPHSRNSPVVTSLQLSSQISPSQSGLRSTRAPTQPSLWRLSNYRASSRSYTAADHWPSRRNSMLSVSYAPSEEVESDDSTSSGLHPAIHADHIPRPASAAESPIHAIATPKPTLLFAIASDDVEQVRTVLESGEAGPNDPVGPQSALAFTLTNDRLARKNDIVKVLLAYGADPSALRNPALNPTARAEGNMCLPLETTLEGMDPATRYFVARADNAHTRQTSRLIYRSFFRPLTRVRYDVVGQDWALEQLFRVLSMHSQRLAVAPIVVLLCGPSGHGKSLLARKFGSLLEVPTHTVNMTTLRSTHDIWQSHSMSPYEEPSSYTLAEFLLANEGKRCVVVLDEIEKTEDQKALWSLLMPWELGRCSLGAGARHIDVHNVIWLGTSNIGHELVFEHHQNRPEQDKPLTREEYLQLMESLRPRVSECLGASLLSRVTTVLPFVPFTLEEKKAIAAESVYALGGDGARQLSPQEVEALVMRALPHYVPGEGARSLHRAISNQLVDGL